MKIVGRFMTLIFCAIIALIAYVSSSLQQIYAASQVDWKVGVRFKLKVKNNYFYKD